MELFPLHYLAYSQNCGYDYICLWCQDASEGFIQWYQFPQKYFPSHKLLQRVRVDRYCLRFYISMNPMCVIALVSCFVPFYTLAVFFKSFS